jgi:hypothetical protein
MTIVKAAAFCPSCSYELPSPGLENCPSCGVRLSVPTNEFFELPYYLAMQMADYVQSMEDRERQKKPITDAERTRFEAIRKAYRTFVRELTGKDRIAALVDAQLMLQEAVHSKLDGDHIKELIGRGRAIGNLAKSLEMYCTYGGSLSDPETKLVLSQPGDEGRSAASTPRGGDTL